MTTMPTEQPDNTEVRQDKPVGQAESAEPASDSPIPETPEAPLPAEASTPASAGPHDVVGPDVTAEEPDGLVQGSPEDLVTDPTAVDPHIDLGLLEAYLFSTHSPLTAGRLAELFNLESTKPIRKALRVLNEQYEQTRRCFRVEQVAGGFQLLSLPDFGDKLKALHQKEQDSKLTKAALEALAIIAYKQPILRAEVESIRGVASGETIRSLMEKHLVKIAGRAEEPGRPILYGTTKRFLEVFGLNSLKDLPQPDALQARAQQMAAAAQRLAESEAQEQQPAAFPAEPAQIATEPTQAETATATEIQEPTEVMLGPGTNDETQTATESSPADDQPVSDHETLPLDEEPIQEESPAQPLADDIASGASFAEPSATRQSESVDDKKDE